MRPEVQVLYRPPRKLLAGDSGRRTYAAAPSPTSAGPTTGEPGETLMSADEKSGAQASPAALPTEEYFEAALRGSADELLDAGGHTELDAMRHSAAHVMAEAVLGIFPDAQLGIGPSID